MGIVRLTLFTIAGIGAGLWWFGRDEGLPTDRIGRDPGDIAALHNGTILAAPLPRPAATPAAPPPTPAATPAPAPTIPVSPPANAASPAASPAVPVPASASPQDPAAASIGALVAEAVAEAQPAPPSLPRLYVTGSKVNMRAGPSTGDAVVAALTRGTEVEDLGTAIPGWSTIRVVATGKRGYMASRFLSPDTP